MVLSSPTSTIGGRFSDLAELDKFSSKSISITGSPTLISNYSSNASKISEEVIGNSGL